EAEAPLKLALVDETADFAVEAASEPEEMQMETIEFESAPAEFELEDVSAPVFEEQDEAPEVAALDLGELAHASFDQEPVAQEAQPEFAAEDRALDTPEAVAVLEMPPEPTTPEFAEEDFADAHAMEAGAEDAPEIEQFAEADDSAAKREADAALAADAVLAG